MNEFLIPSGLAYFPGNYMKLLKCINRMDSTMIADHNFKCTYPSNHISYGKFTLLRIRGRIRFVFRCNIERSDDSCKIEYKVYPSGTFIWAFFILAFALINSALRDGWQALVLNIIEFAVFVGIMIVAYILCRRKAIRKFVREFEECCSQYPTQNNWELHKLNKYPTLN